MANSYDCALKALIATVYRLAFARPEQPIGDVLAHARPESGLERLPGVLLRIFHRIADLQAVRDCRGDGGRERAARTVIGARQPLPVVGAHDAVLTVERIHDLRRVFMRAG